MASGYRESQESSILESPTLASSTNQNNEANVNQNLALGADQIYDMSHSTNSGAKDRLEASQSSITSNRNPVFGQLPRSPVVKERAPRTRSNKQDSSHSYIFDDMRESEITDDDTSITSRILHIGKSTSLRDLSDSPEISSSVGLDTSGNDSQFLLKNEHCIPEKEEVDAKIYDSLHLSINEGSHPEGDAHEVSMIHNDNATTVCSYSKEHHEEVASCKQINDNEDDTTEFTDLRHHHMSHSTNSSLNPTHLTNESSKNQEHADVLRRLSNPQVISPSRDVYKEENDHLNVFSTKDHFPLSTDYIDPEFSEREEDTSFFEKSRSAALNKSVLMKRSLFPPRPHIEERFIRSNGSPVKATEPDLSSIMDPNINTSLQDKPSDKSSTSNLSHHLVSLNVSTATNASGAKEGSCTSPKSIHDEFPFLQSPISNYEDKFDSDHRRSPRYLRSSGKEDAVPTKEYPKLSRKPNSASNTPLRPVSIRLRGGLLSFDDPEDISDEDDNSVEIRASPSTCGTDNYLIGHEDVGDDTRFRQRVLSIAQERRLSGMKHSQNGEHVSQDEGLRRSQAYSRKLESENMELRLKLQQYREGNATNQEFERIKKQLSLAEKRIDDLTESLERKNAVIAQLCGERDAARLKYETEIVAIAEDIERLEQSAAKYDPEAIANMASALPQHVSRSDGSKELLFTIQNLVAQNSELSDKVEHLSGLTDDLKRENVAISNEKTETRTKFLNLTADFQTLSSDSSDLKALLDNTMSKLQSTEAQLAQSEADLASKTSILTRLEAEIATTKAETDSKISHLSELHQQELTATTNRHENELNTIKHRLDMVKQEFAARTAEFEAHDSHQQCLLADEYAARQNIETHAQKLQEIVLESKNASYVIVREFFEELFNVMGPQIKSEVDERIAHIVKKSAEESRSKIPLLTDLVIEYTRNLAVLAVRPASDAESNQKIWELEREVQTLQTIVETQWTKVGADRVLLAQLRDLKRRLKLEEEKRKSDWIEYQRAVDRQKRTSVTSRQS